MDDEVPLSAEAAALANRIKAIDRDLDTLEQRTQDSVIFGLHNSGSAMSANLVQVSADKQREERLAERAELVTKLKAEIARS